MFYVAAKVTESVGLDRKQGEQEEKRTKEKTLRNKVRRKRKHRSVTKANWSSREENQRDSNVKNPTAVFKKKPRIFNRVQILHPCPTQSKVIRELLTSFKESIDKKGCSQLSQESWLKRPQFTKGKDCFFSLGGVGTERKTWVGKQTTDLEWNKGEAEGSLLIRGKNEQWYKFWRGGGKRGFT